MLTQSELKDYLHYDPDTGIFTLVKLHRRRPAGTVLGGARQGYLQLTVKKRTYPAARLAWLYMVGEHPNGVIDHINRVRDDNRWVNLRCVSYSDNAVNSEYARGVLGVRGVRYAEITPKNKKPYLAAFQKGNVRRKKRFNTIEEAKTWYDVLRAGSQ
jgi:hypothetical protein